MQASLQPGLHGEGRYAVTADMSAPHLPRVVLSTPSMVSLIERTCLLTAQDHLDEGETTVGTHICVSHDAAALEGEEVVITCQLTSMESRRLNFEVSVEGPQRRISSGTHQRAVVSLSRMT
jgi:fluoroacetyl-CoA thioesterase